MKAFCAILLSALFLLTTIQPVVYTCLYELNKKAITEKYCVNKNVKGSCCQGKCHLNKVIAKAEKENQNPYSTSNLKIKEVEIICQQLQQANNAQTIIHLVHSPAGDDNLLDGFSGSLLKPPAVLV